MSYIKYWFRATNQHGIHSPFVYDFVTKGLYLKSSKDRFDIKEFQQFGLTKKEQQLLRKVFEYFQIELEIKEINTETFSLDKFHKKQYYSNLNNIDLEEIINTKAIEFIICKGIHNDEVSFEKWTKLCAISQATVTIDLFYFGLVFFRAEQRKEHFVIRI